MVMSDTECARCGSPMPARGVCPVCEISHDFGGAKASSAVEPAPEAPAPTPLGRLWQSGRLGALLAAFCFLAAAFVPLVYVKFLGTPGPRQPVTAVEMALAQGPFGRYLKSALVFALPGAALGLLQFVISRRTRAAMVSTRPLLLVVSLIPVVAAVMPLLKLAKRQRFDYGVGPALALVALGAVAGTLSALHFGRGVPDEHERERDDDEEE